jgi:aarF domain-containing kinase
MEYLDGVHLPAFLTGDPPQELRDHFGSLIVQAGCRLHCAGRLLYADPHPGNYLFRADGRLGWLDFGCVRPYTDREWECNRLADLAIRGDDDDMVRAIRATLGLTEGQEIDPEILATNVAFCRWIWRPYQRLGPFDFGDPGYLREGVEHVVALGRARIPSPWLTMNAFIERWYFGMGAMLYRLRARVDMRSIWLRERQAAGWGPP